MAPFHLPWTTFSAFIVLAATITLALVWAMIDKYRESSHEEADPKEVGE